MFSGNKNFKLIKSDTIQRIHGLLVLRFLLVYLPYSNWLHFSVAILFS